MRCLQLYNIYKIIQKNRSMRKQLQFDKFHSLFPTLQPLNQRRSVFVGNPTSKQELKQPNYIIKCISLRSETNDARLELKIMQDCYIKLKKLYANSQAIMYKPEFFSIDDKQKFLYLVQAPFGISLESMILYHQKNKQSFNKFIVHNFVCKIYDAINRLKVSESQITQANIKPSNIFLTHNQSDIEWKISQLGLPCGKPNKYYQQVAQVQMKSKGNISSMYDQQHQSNLYALGIMLLEMTTLLPINYIFEHVKGGNRVQDLRDDNKKYFNQIKNIYGPELAALIASLLQDRNNVKDTMREYKDTTPQYTPIVDYYKYKIEWSSEHFLNLSKQNPNPYLKVVDMIKKDVDRNEITCSMMLERAQKYDKDLEFVLFDLEKLERFLRDFGADLSDLELYQLSFYMRYNSHLNYMEFIKLVYPTQDVMFSVIKIGIQTSSTRKSFFNDYAGGREVWKSEDITQYLHGASVFIEQKQINKVLQAWSGVSKRAFIRFDEFNKVFKQCGHETMTDFKNQNKLKSQNNEKGIADILHELKDKLSLQNKNLINFFRTYDTSNKWVVGTDIEKQIKKRISINDKLFYEACEQMWEIAGIVSQTKKILNYITLLKVAKIYSMTELFKLVLVEKINESNREQFYRKYQKEKKGWSIESFIDFNEYQQLDFEKRQLHMIFNDLDKDRSGFLSQKQLIFQLTGLKQFDKQLIIQNIKEKAGRWDLFQLFMRFDKNKDLYYDSPTDFLELFECMEVQIPPQHCQDLFRNGMKNGKYPYLDFLRYFLPPSVVFVKACMFFIDYFYDGNFQKFYDFGRIKNKKKWSMQSFNHINQQFLMGFTYNQVNQIWDTLNPDKQQSLTKQQIAKIFNCSCEPQQNILGIESGSKGATRQTKYQNKKEQKKTDDKFKKQSLKPEPNKNKNDLIESILDKKLNEVMLCFIQKSRQNGEISFNDLCACLDDLRIKYLRNVAMKNTSQFQRMDEQHNIMKINFVNLMMFVCQFKEEGKQERKAQCMAILIKQLIRFHNLNLDDIFKKCRKPGVMKLTDYQNFIRDIVKTQVYFDDIEDTWKFWGSPDYLTQQDFNKIISATSGKIQKPNFKVAKQFSFADQQKQTNKTPGEQQSPESPYFPKRMRSRKSSRDSRQSEQQNYQIKVSEAERNQKQSNNNRQQSRNQRQRQKEGNNSIGSNLPPRPTTKKESQYEKKEQKRQNKEKQISKAFVTEKFESKIKQKGSEALNNLFSRTNAVSSQQFATFVQSNYQMKPNQSLKLAETLNTFGKVKIQTVKKYLKKIESPQKEQKSKERTSIRGQTGKREWLTKKEGSKGKDMKQSIQLNEKLRLQDPRKMRINVPLVKQHIKILTTSFAKRFDINQMQPYFFESNTTINEQDFIKKCQQINPSISKSMYQKIFQYLKPKSGLISSISFKLSFNFDEDIQIQQTYLPDEIEHEIKTIFDKADKDKSGYIEINEIQTILSTLGMNETQKEIQIYFQKIDQNFDKKISFKQFKIFIEDNILPFVSDFDEDVDQLMGLLKINDVFRTGYLPVMTVGAVLERYGVKIGEKDLNVLNRFMANQNGQISIRQLINKLYFPSAQQSTSLKSILYRIRWKKRLSIKQLQKIFQNISTNFLSSYTSTTIKHKLLSPSTFITPILNQSKYFYNDIYYKNINKIQQKSTNLVNTLKVNDLIVQIKFIDAVGIPIPQNQIVKNGILYRYVNVTFYDTSSQEAKDCIIGLEVEFDVDVEDQWIFNKNNRSVFVKIGNYQPRRYEKILLLFQFIATMVDGQKCIDISCGTASIPIKQLQVDNKTSRKVKMIAGLPNKSKQIDKMSISKRKGWRGFINAGQMQSQFQMQIIPATKIQDKIQLLASMPEKSIINRKAIHLMWTFRQYFAFKSVDQKRINTDFGNHFIVRTFLLCLDVPDVYQELLIFWKEKIQPKIPSIDIARRVFHFLMIDMHIIIHCKQFELLPSLPSKSTFMNKSLKNTRKKLIGEVFANIEDWIITDVRRDYKRRKGYGVDSAAFIIEQRQIGANTRNISNQLMKAK